MINYYLFISDTLYTGTWDGKVLKIVNGQIKRTFYLAEKSDECGRL